MRVDFKKCFIIGLVLLLHQNLVLATTTKSKSTAIQLINGLPYVEVMINGKGPYLFGFDTGFGAELELDAELAKELNIVVSGQTAVGDGSGVNEITLNTAKISNIRIGDYLRSNCTAVLRTNARKNVSGMENVKGIIGIGLFPKHKIVIDYPKLQFSVESEDLPNANDKYIFDYEEVGGGVPRIKLTVGSFYLNAVIDTRSMSGEFKIPTEIAEKLTFLTTPKLIGKGRTISNTIDINEVKIKEEIAIGQLIFIEPTITYPSLNENAIIGSKVLQKFSIAIDTKNKRIQFTKGIEPKKNEQLLEYTGKYGDRTLTVVGDFLYIQRPNGAVLKMLPKNKDEFTLEIVPNAILQFERDATNQIKSIKVSKGDGKWEIADKS